MRALIDDWTAAWPKAIAAWGSSVRMSEPMLLIDGPQTAGMFAWFDLAEVRVNIDLREIDRLGLQDCAIAVLAHEIGHHILAPADLATTARIVERCRRGLIDQDHRAAEIANLWNDMLINDRLARLSGLDMAAPYRGANHTPPAYFAVILRTYELLWNLPRGDLTQATDDQNTDATLLARHVRVFARDAVEGAAGFAALMRQWLDADDGMNVSGCKTVIPDDAQPAGLADDDTLGAPVVHPALDPRVNPEAGEVPLPQDQQSDGQTYGPAQLESTYAALGIKRDAVADWYTTRARKHLVPFPVERQRRAPEPQWEGLETWEIGDDLAEVEWLDSSLRSSPIIPGVTTVRRIIADVASDEMDRSPVDLDLYVDSSASMPHPRRGLAPAILGGTVLIMSALRVGARARVTSWASPGQVATSGDFLRDLDPLMKALLHFFGGGTSFPLHELAQAHLSKPRAKPVHIAVISDDGVSSMFGTGQPAELKDVAARSLIAAGGGGSLVLQVPRGTAERAKSYAGDYDVYGVPDQLSLIEFARSFARKHWGRT